MSKNLRMFIGGVALVMAVVFIVLWAVAPKMTSESVVVSQYGWGPAIIVLIVMWGLPVVTMLGLAFASWKDVLGKKHYQLERELSLRPADVTEATVTKEAGNVEAKGQAAVTHRINCPNCRTPFELVEGRFPIECPSCHNTWNSLADVCNGLLARGYGDQAQKLWTSINH